MNLMVKFQMAMAYKGSLVELPLFGTYWVYERVYNLGNHLVITIKNVTYIYLLASVHLG